MKKEKILESLAAWLNSEKVDYMITATNLIDRGI